VRARVRVRVRVRVQVQVQVQVQVSPLPSVQDVAAFIHRSEIQHVRRDLAA
jgi:hypothetical protein